jgi:hypothetical protein
MSRPAESYRGARKNRQHGRKDEGNTVDREDRKAFTPHAYRIVAATMAAMRAKAEAKK